MKINTSLFLYPLKNSFPLGYRKRPVAWGGDLMRIQKLHKEDYIKSDLS